MNKFGPAFALAATVAASGLTGCAGTHFPSNPFGNPGNNTVVNKPGDQGVKAYGSDACRTAGIDVVPGAAFSARYGAGTPWGRGVLGSNYYWYHNRSAEFRNAVSVRSINGFPYTLVPTSPGSYLFAIAGAAGGAALGIEAARRNGYGGGYRHGGRGATTTLAGVAGAAVGAVGGQAVDQLLNAGKREAGDRCRTDTMNGAYDPVPRATQSGWGPGAPRPGDYRSGYGGDGYDAGREVDTRAVCPAGYTCTRRDVEPAPSQK